MTPEPDPLAQLFIGKVGPILFRLVWWNHLDPSKRDKFSEEFVDAILVGALKSYEVESNQQIARSAFGVVKAKARPILERLVRERFSVDLDDLLPNVNDESFDNVARRMVVDRTKSEVHRLMAEQYEQFLKRTENLTPELISAMKTINEEYLIWMKSHTESLPNVAWEAFERLTGEILSSQGFDVKLTGRSRGDNADIIAIEKLDGGERLKYLVECKRYKERIGVGIVNGVIGAKVFQGIEHAMLVTTSFFTRDVINVKPRLDELKLELKDGNDVVDWLKDYKFHDDWGLWLENDWYS